MIERGCIETPIGPMVASADTQGLVSLRFTDTNEQPTHANSLFDELQRQISEYFLLHRHTFSLPLSLTGTAFQLDAWACLQQVSYAQTISYAKQAFLMNKPNATRAVARANKHNPIAIVVPCHRIISSDGTLGGYNGGLWRKQYLLELERGYAPPIRPL